MAYMKHVKLNNNYIRYIRYNIKTFSRFIIIRYVKVHKKKGRRKKL